MALNFEQRRQKILKNSSSRLSKITGRPAEEFPNSNNTQIWDEYLKNNDTTVRENKNERIEFNSNKKEKHIQHKTMHNLQKYWLSIMFGIMVTLLIKLHLGRFIGNNLILPFILIQPMFIFLNFSDIVNDNANSMVFMMLCSWLNTTQTGIVCTSLKILQYLINHLSVYCFVLISLSYFVN